MFIRYLQSRLPNVSIVFVQRIFTFRKEKSKVSQSETNLGNI